MTEESRSAHREFDVDDEFSRSARSPGGISRNAALARAAAEIDRVTPQVADYIKKECQRLEKALLLLDGGKRIEAAFVAEAYAASQHVRDVAESVGYPLVGLIAKNLCTIFEAVEAAKIDYPTAVIDCHQKALRLALSRRYRGKQPEDLPELSEGLLQIAKIAQAVAEEPDAPTLKTA